MEKRILKEPHKLANKIMESKPKGGWKETTNSIKENIHPNTQINNQTIRNNFTDTINKQNEGKTKTQYIIDNKTWKAGHRPAYMNTLTRHEVSTIFKARTRMIDVKNNFRGKYKDTTCRMCKNQLENQEHVLTECHNIHKDNTTKIYTNDIFEEDPNKLKKNCEKNWIK